MLYLPESVCRCLRVSCLRTAVYRQFGRQFRNVRRVSRGGFDVKALLGEHHWLGSTPVTIALGVATVLEVGSYYIPWLDNALDSIATPASILAGTLISGEMMPEVLNDSSLKWILGAVMGGGPAGLVQAATVVTRGASTATTGGARQSRSFDGRAGWFRAHRSTRDSDTGGCRHFGSCTSLLCRPLLNPLFSANSLSERSRIVSVFQELAQARLHVGLVFRIGYAKPVPLGFQYGAFRLAALNERIHQAGDIAFRFRIIDMRFQKFPEVGFKAGKDRRSEPQKFIDTIASSGNRTFSPLRSFPSAVLSAVAEISECSSTPPVRRPPLGKALD